MKDIYNEIRRLNVIFSCGTGGIVDLSSLDLRNVDLELYDFTDKHMANTILNPFKLDDTDFTNANMFQVNFVSSKQNATISWDYLLKITPVITSINDMYSEEKIKLVESCLKCAWRYYRRTIKNYETCNYRIYTKSNSNRSIRK